MSAQTASAPDDLAPGGPMPPLLVGAALAFWGWETGQPALGVALGIAFEAAQRLSLRVELQPANAERLADLCTVFFVGFIVITAASSPAQQVSTGILTGFKYLPVFLLPIGLMQALSERRRVRLSALLRAVRKAKRRDPATRDPWVDVSGPYFAISLLSAGVANQRGPVYFAGLALLVGWALFALRPRHSRPWAWALLFTLGVGGGYAGHVSLHQLQTLLENWVADFFVRGMDADPYRAQTDIGAIGRLKLHDTIVMRVVAPRDDAPRLRLLHRGSFNVYADGGWAARRAPLAGLRSAEDGTTWSLTDAPPAPAAVPDRDAAPSTTARIAIRLEAGKALLALPAGTTTISQLPAATLQRNRLGAVRADIGGEWIEYRVEAGPGDTVYGPPGEEDLDVPPAEQAALARLARQLGLAGLATDEALRRVARHFDGFAYATYQDSAPPPGRSAIADFLERTRQGHCEYFAAATTLLLRAAGIPARYATGFAMLEYSALEEAFVVRARHAHAWTRVWTGERWIDLDTTPPQWFAIEDARAPAWQALADLLRWAGFRWSQRGEIRLGNGAYGVLAVLVLVLGWRLTRGNRLARAQAARAAQAARRHPGADSAFYAVEAALIARSGARPPHQPLAAWISGLAGDLDEDRRRSLHDALELHQRYRFDPDGLPPDERARLRAVCDALARSIAAAPPRDGAGTRGGAG